MLYLLHRLQVQNQSERSAQRSQLRAFLRSADGNKSQTDFVLVIEGSKNESNWRIDKMNASLTATLTLLAGLSMILSIACDSTPAGSEPTPTDSTPVNPISTTPAMPEPTPADPTTPDTEDDVGDVEALREAQMELNRHRALWTSSRSSDYSFVLAPMCFCPQDLLDPVTVRVKDGVVAAVTYVESGKAPEHDGYGRYVTIDELFDIIQEAIDGKASQITATYDPEFGYPRDVRIDYEVRRTDEEYIFTVSSYSSANGQ